MPVVRQSLSYLSEPREAELLAWNRHHRRYADRLDVIHPDGPH